MKKIFLLILLVFFSSGVFAIGISPGRTTLDFSPGLEKTIDFTVLNSEQKDITLVWLVQGELKDYVKISEGMFNMRADEREKKLSYIVNLPNDLPPGTRTAEILVVELPQTVGETSSASVGASLAVATQLHVKVPYPGKYAESSLNVFGPDKDGVINFVLPVVSRGELDLVRVRGVVDIYTALNEKVFSLNTNEVKINSGQRVEISAKWEPKVSPGKYRAVATILYDEQTLTLEKEFNVGQQALEVVRIEANNFQLGEIAKLEVLVDNKWGEAIIGAFAEMQVYNSDGKIMAEFKSQTYDVPALEKKIMVLFWDTAGVRKGKYDSSIYLKFGQQSLQNNFNLEVSDRQLKVIGVGYVVSSDSSSGGNNSLMIVLISAIGVLILVNLLWFMYFRKKLSSKKKS